jgi:DNA-binding MarR family transcriptional regulator/N-acetylglutamate synthase-like GNAT family acetyltransferase
MLAKADLSEPPAVDAVRAFNRFYTQKIGILSDAPLKGGLSLTESRVLYELAHRDLPTASEIKRDLGLDQGYLSRILRHFEKQGLLKRKQSATDRRQSRIALTRKGRAFFARIDRTWQQATGELIAPLGGARRQELAASMGRIRALLGGDPDAPPFVLREPRVGDMGWIVHRQAALYATEYDWTVEFEALVAEIVAAFIRDFDPKRERCWIAERHGEIVGSVFLVKSGEKVGKLRLLYVEPDARGLGIGRALVDACIAEARRTRCEKLVLWTNDILVSARKIYEAAGFRLVGEAPHYSFGKNLVGQDWELAL